MTPAAAILVTIGMLAAAGIGWQIGRIMSPRPSELRKPATILEQREQSLVSPPAEIIQTIRFVRFMKFVRLARVFR
jgi:hypothetical protein